MHKIQFLALLGLSPDLQKELKELLPKHLDNPISWVPAIDTKVQAIIINTNVIDSTQVQTFLQRKAVNVVGCHRDVNDTQLGSQFAFPCLNLANYTQETFNLWLATLTGQPIPTSNPLDTQADNSNTHSNDSDAEATESADTVTLNEDYQTLLEHIDKQSGFYLATYNSNNLWIDAKNGQAFLGFEREKITAFDTLRWRELSEETFQPPSSARRLQLDLWLFEALWQTKDKHLIKVHQQGLYKLTRWPRPLKPRGRSEILRLAAFIQKTPMTIEQLSHKTGYDRELTERFINAGLKTKQVIQTGIADRNLEPAQPQEERTIDNAKLSLLGRLRQKLKL